MGNLEPPKVNIAPSVEIRWFFDGDPRRIEDWFKKTIPGVEQEDKRDDFYLVFPGASHSGIKLREYPTTPRTLNLEFKLREKDGTAVNIVDGVWGVVENWRKWSSQANTDVDGYIKSFGCGNEVWTKVEKNRRLSKFSFENGAVKEVPKGKRATDGCNVEFTTIALNSEPAGAGTGWSTVGFEAFATTPSVDVHPILLSTVRHLLTKAPHDICLRAEDSCSYPQWLLRRRGVG